MRCICRFFRATRLRRTIAYGRSGTEMPAWAKSEGGPLTDKQIDILVDGIYSHWGNGRPAPAGVPEYAENGGGDANHGRQLFMRSCFMCHAKNMQPGPITTPAYLELASNQMLRTSIIVGRMDLGMPSVSVPEHGQAAFEPGCDGPGGVFELAAYDAGTRCHQCSHGTAEQRSSSHENENGTARRGRPQKEMRVVETDREVLTSKATKETMAVAAKEESNERGE